MMSDLFSTFDFGFGVSNMGFSILLWLAVVSFLIFTMNSAVFFYSGSRLGGFKSMIGSFVVDSLQIYQISSYGGGSIFFMGVMVILWFFNIIGMGPYVFLISSHFAFAFSFSVVVWVSMIIFSMSSSIHSLMSSFVFSGLPSGAAMGLVWIEVVSNVVRALTLGLRLCLNLVSGQVFAGLLGGFGSIICTSSVGLSSLLCSLVLMGLMMMEFFIGSLQAILFIYLITMYVEELSHS
uniref:ATP synthase subunit a n=1 Tax=Panopea abrupta TaxID=134997 RepID=A0A343AXN3_9BIVA|nr:ATP synthase F0 subunit 6 [Panopea abrupta]YP_010715722.1 ATP synthase F0 subunit 6 [Panopea japonica]APU51881.1 ATP synthase F0 subunit 6 [Panopea abrupta]WDE73825.1 ATP synthase F0 subunit 6 [Panopea japonica]WDE73838.1 ATP synthase F0 subunit 6 [Panopea japonica]